MKTDERIADQLADELRRSVARYREKLSNGDPNKTVPLYAQAMTALRRLSDSDQAHVLDFLHVVATDTAALMLAAIDGIGDLGTLGGKFRLTYDGEAVEGDLTDYFLDKCSVTPKGTLKSL